ncbi:DUF418 domain-containing protein [Nonomuraea sp. NPDC046802]|uniref:DUF418 domain-containing protein n=1 Tax=Nonomuraea sp. NPDC046802 TaxID=3154919 RepID=UPI0033C29777
MQSVVFVALFHPYGLRPPGRPRPGGRSPYVAVLTWLASLAGAEAMRRAGHRGPAEILLRRLAYRSGPR